MHVKLILCMLGMYLTSFIRKIFPDSGLYRSLWSGRWLINIRNRCMGMSWYWNLQQLYSPFIKMLKIYLAPNKVAKILWLANLHYHTVLVDVIHCSNNIHGIKHISLYYYCKFPTWFWLSYSEFFWTCTILINCRIRIIGKGPNTKISSLLLKRLRESVYQHGERRSFIWLHLPTPLHHRVPVYTMNIGA